MTAGETHQAIEATFRIERARLVAGLARVVRNVDLAEELAQDALVIALAEWPRTGVPANPGAWLMTAAKRRAIDAIRRDKMRERKHEDIARERDGAVDDTAGLGVAMNDDLGDELLGLVFTACHPVLSADARAALTLRVRRRSDDGRDRPCFPLQRGDDRPAHRPGEEDDRKGRTRLRGAAGCRTCGEALLGAGGHLPHLQ